MRALYTPHRTAKLRASSLRPVCQFVAQKESWRAAERGLVDRQCPPRESASTTVPAVSAQTPGQFTERLQPPIRISPCYLRAITFRSSHQQWS